MEKENFIGSASYSPDDNKIRLYPFARLDKETYNRVHGAGFRWAPKQELFVAPMWTPEREDLLLELCGEIDDEDKSLTERAEERADRFEDYSGNRLEDANRARAAVSAIADNIPLGQPILVGHHSERHARKDAERIENGMRKAVKMWKQSEYWTSRAKGAIRHAKYKERPDVRARRIKGIEADKRKQERCVAQYERTLKLWNLPNLDHDLALKIAGSDPTRIEMPRKDGDREDFKQSPDIYSAISGHYPNLYAPRTWQECQARVLEVVPRYIAGRRRWIEHYENRLAYERAMLGEAGGTVADKTGPEVGGGCQCWASHRGGWSWIKKVNKISVTVWDNWGNSADLTGARNFTRNIPFDKLRAVMTKTQVDEARAQGRLIDMEDKTGFFISGEKPPDGLKPWTHLQPDAPKIAEEITEGRTIWNSDGTDGPALICLPPKKPDATPFKQMADQLKAGVQVVVANQLFPTPPDLAQRMVDEAGIEPGNRVLEPSAGTGAILAAMGGRMFEEPGTEPYRDRDQLYAVEINPTLAERLRVEFPLTHVGCFDFLTANGHMGAFDRILMNPPFENGADIKHIQHALTMLKPGGRLVAICANGPRQNEKLKPLASMWEELPEDTFKQQGTGVNTALIVIEG